MASTLEYRVLGPLEIRSNHQPVRLPGPREQRLLAVLLLAANRPVPASELVDQIWGSDPPTTVRRQVHNGLSRLRRQLHTAGAPAEVLVNRGAGYQLCLDAAQLDVHRFRQLAAHAADLPSREFAARARHLRAALSLWRGPVLPGLSGPAIEAAATQLGEHRLSAYEQCIDAELELGEHQRLSIEISELLTAHPLRERLVDQLMRALHGSGRSAEALQAYQRLARRLADELGVDPGPELRQLYVAILRGELPPANAEAGDPAMAASPGGVSEPARPSGAAAGRPVPQQLPARTGGFVGRGHELAVLHACLDAGTSTGTPRLAAITGTAGVGKTALALQWSHHVRGQFPDGQLYVDLRGYGAERPMPPGQALESLLRALGTGAGWIPPDLATRSGWFRTLATGRRMLMVLDNACSAAQVRPLLPGADSCFVLVTSRERLRGLVAREGALAVPLGRFSPDEAGQMCRELLGERADREPESMARLSDRCARLPLALRIAAERLRERGDRPVAELVAELADEQRRLDLLDAGGDVQASVRTLFSWSYRHLLPDEARLFRLCSLHPGQDTDPHALAALLGADLRTTSRLLDTLVRTHLVELTGEGRHRLHDLLRAYAGELTNAIDGEPERRAARSRLFHHYLRTAAAAGRAAVG